MGAGIGAQSSAAHRIIRAAAPVAAFIALYILSAAAAYAESCSPAEPRRDSGAGFTPFGEREQALGRAGKRGRAWEWALGTDTRNRQKVQASLDWVSGRVYSWTLVNSGAGSEVLEIRDAGRLRLRLAYPSGMDAGNALELRVLTHPSIGAKTSIEASLTSLNGHSVAGSLSQPGTRARTEQTLYYYFPQMAQGFTAEGTVSLTYAKKPRSGFRVQFTMRAGTIPCSSTGNAPTVSVTSPAANSVFSAPATVTVMANAQDSDGTVAQVAFFANGNLIGTATSGPFTVQWANVPAGAYSLTAVATDNEGLQTTSAAVPITVGTEKALYFIHVDHLNTPRLVADGTRKTVWRWDQQEPFGATPANEDPDGDAIAFGFPQRFPGQYYDAETLLHYNYFRDYDSQIGRYTESDPIGLAGGLNTFVYVVQDPLTGRDLFGLICAFIDMNTPVCRPTKLVREKITQQYVSMQTRVVPGASFPDPTRRRGGSPLGWALQWRTVLIRLGEIERLHRCTTWGVRRCWDDCTGLLESEIFGPREFDKWMFDSSFADETPGQWRTGDIPDPNNLPPPFNPRR